MPRDTFPSQKYYLKQNILSIEKSICTYENKSSSGKIVEREIFPTKDSVVYNKY